jgi:hypothetical protein
MKIYIFLFVFLFISLASAEEIKLNSLEINTTNWCLNSENEIIIRSLDLDNNFINLTNLSINLKEIEYFKGDIFKTENDYRQIITIGGSNLTNLEILVTAEDNGKIINKSLNVILKDCKKTKELSNYLDGSIDFFNIHFVKIICIIAIILFIILVISLVRRK